MSRDWPNTLLDPSEYRNPMRQLEDALVMVESRGNPDARREGSQYVGLLQIGRKYAIDAGIPGDQYVRELWGNARASRAAFRRYMQKYANIHKGQMVYVALLHHAGPIIEDVREALDGGAVATIDGALQLVDADGPAWFDKDSELEYLARTLYWYSLLEDRKRGEDGKDVAAAAGRAIGEAGRRAGAFGRGGRVAGSTGGKTPRKTGSLADHYADKAADAAEQAAGAFADWATGFVDEEEPPEDYEGEGGDYGGGGATDEPSLMEKHYRGDFG